MTTRTTARVFLRPTRIWIASSSSTFPSSSSMYSAFCPPPLDSVALRETRTRFYYRCTKQRPSIVQSPNHFSFKALSRLLRCLLILLAISSSCKAEDYYTEVVVGTDAPTISPTTSAPTTSAPTVTPKEVIESNRAFYEDDDDTPSSLIYKANVYVATLSDVVLCLSCCFFWILWLVGAIFPSRMQDLYREEGIVVLGDVVDSYTQEGGAEFGLPTYHAVVRYVVPGRLSKRHRRRLLATNGDAARTVKGESLRNQEDISGYGRILSQQMTGLSGLGDAVSHNIYEDREKQRLHQYQQTSIKFSQTLSKDILDVTLDVSTERTAALVPEYDDNDEASEAPIDPEGIGGVSIFLGTGTPRLKSEPIGPVRVKKRFDTCDLLEPGESVELLVLPGKPTSGILKLEFENDYGENGIDVRKGSNSMDHISAFLGVTLASVSVIGAVNAVLKLPYYDQMYGWIILVSSLMVMWPVAMTTYKTVHRVRNYAMNKIISFEHCGNDTLRDLSTLQFRGRDSIYGTRDNADDDDDEYFIMVGDDKTRSQQQQRRGVMMKEEDADSAVSSLSGAQVV